MNFQDTSQSLKKLENEKRHKPFIYNLSGDAILNGRLVHFIPTGSTEFGSKDKVIRIFGPGYERKLMELPLPSAII